MALDHIIIANDLLVLLDVALDRIDYSYWTDYLLRKAANIDSDREFSIKSASKYIEIAKKDSITFLTICSEQHNYIPSLQRQFFASNVDRNVPFSMMKHFHIQNLFNSSYSRRTIGLEEFLNEEEITWDKDLEEAIADQEAHYLLREIYYKPSIGTGGGSGTRAKNYQMIITFIVSLLIMSFIFGFLLLDPGF